MAHVATKLKKEKLDCGERRSNTRPSDLQSDALPTELSPQDVKYNIFILIILYSYVLVKVPAIFKTALTNLYTEHKNKILA